MQNLELFLGVPTESLATRVVLASILAVPLVRLVLRAGLKAPRARVLASFVPSVVLFSVVLLSLGSARLPSLWLPFDGDGMSVPVGGGYLEVAPLTVGVLLTLWAAVASFRVGLRTTRVLRARRRVQALVDHADVAPPELLRQLDRVSAAMRVPTPHVAVVEDCPGGAAVFGIRRPILIVDARLVRRLDRRELEGVLAHEVAHVKRRDNLSSLALAFVRDVFFFVPGGAWALRQLHDEREVAADQCAVHATRRPAALAGGLLKVLDLQGPVVACSALLPTAERGTLVSRVRRLVEEDEVTTRRRTAEAAVVAGVAGLATALGVWVPGTVASSSGVEGVSLLWAPTTETAQVADTEAIAFSVYRSAPLAVAQPEGQVPVLDDDQPMTRAMWRACVVGDAAVCEPPKPYFALPLRPAPTVRLDPALVEQWRPEPVLTTSVGISLYVLRPGERVVEHQLGSGETVVEHQGTRTTR